MVRAYKFRLYPNKEQENQILRTFGCCRFVFNHYLDRRINTYKETGKTFGYSACATDLTQLKMQDSSIWLNEVDATALQSSLRNLDDAYQRFFDGIKKGKKVGYPNFKCKHDRRQSYTTKNNNGSVAVECGRVKLPKLGWVKCCTHRTVEGVITKATISRTPSGKYYVSLSCKTAKVEPLPTTGNTIGIDMGIKSYAVTSTGVEYPNPKYLRQSEKKLARLQRQLSRKTKGSANWNKARIKVARLYEYVTNQRRDMQHKLSIQLIRKNDIICIEDLEPKKMQKKRFVAKYVADAAFGEFRRQLTYKAEWYGKQIVVVDRNFASSQLCSCCGAKWPGTKKLSVRRWVCPECGATHDRDTNAAINILNEGLRLLA